MLWLLVEGKGAASEAGIKMLVNVLSHHRE